MKIAIDGNGYGNAQVAFEGANHRAATAYDDLTSRLRGLGAMAGSDSTSADFAAAYDEAAAGAVGALGDLVASFASVGRLSTASLVEYRAADEASTMGSVVAGPVVFEGSMPERGYVAVLPSTPPTCLGGDPPGLPHEVAWVLDQIEGFVWPGADTDRLHRAAATWRRTADEVAVLATYCNSAQRGLAHEVSPEIPLAVAATDDLRDAVEEVAARLSELGGACESYADQVEEHRQQVLDLVWAMLRDAVIVQGIGIVLGFVTAGITAAGAAAVNAARIAIEAPRILRVITALRELVSAGARTVRVTLEAVTRVRVRLRRFVEARVGARGASYGPRSLGAGQRLRYEASPKHGPYQRGRSAPAPTNGQEVLDFSVPLRPATTDRRVAVDPETGEYVVFDMTADGVFHGHVRPWKGLSQAMQNALRNAGLVNRKEACSMNEKMRYSEPDPATRADLALALAGGDGLTAAETLIGVVSTDPDRGWLEDTCLAIARDHASENLRGVAVTCLGHIARLFGEIDRDKVMPALAELAQQPGLAGRVEDALDDIDMFA